MAKEKENAWGLNPATLTALATVATAILVYFSFFQPSGYIVNVLSSTDPCVKTISSAWNSVYVTITLRNLGDKPVAAMAYVISDSINFSSSKSLIIAPSEVQSFSFSGNLNLSQPYPPNIKYIGSFNCPNKNCKDSEGALFVCNYERNETMENTGNKPYYQLIPS